MELAIAELALGKCVDTISRNSLIYNTSSEEQKRVSIIQEILVDPRLLILDESTSELDSMRSGTLGLLVAELR